MNIKTRLYTLTVLNVLVCVAIGTVGYVGIKRLHPQHNNTGTYRAVVEALESIESAQNALRGDVLSSLSTEKAPAGGTLTIDSLKKDIQSHSRDLASAMARLSALPVPVEVTWNIADGRRHVATFTSLAAAIPDQLGRRSDLLNSRVASFQDTFTLLNNGTSETKKMLHALWQKDRAQDIAFAQSIQNAVVTTLLLGIACVIVLVLITLRSIVEPIGEVIEGLGLSSAEVEISAQKMSLYAEDLSQSATEQAAAVQESVASMTQMSSMIAQTSDSSTESLTNVRRMAERTQDGNRVMERLASSTEAINQANGQLREMVDIIGEISGRTSIINDIVFKTQLLSFNASIEAARAGQHGRGFAVVAEEFGNLAEMSGKAAKEIQSLLETSKKHVTEIVEMTHQRVSDGLAVSKEALTIFHEISRDTNQITKQIQRIAEATREQTIGVQQTSTAMNQMDQAAQRNSLLAGDTSRSASDLSDQSRRLASMMRGLLTLISSNHASPPTLAPPKSPTAPQRTQVFEVGEPLGSLDQNLLEEAATKLKGRASPSRNGQTHANDEDFHPYNGSSPR